MNATAERDNAPDVAAADPAAPEVTATNAARRMGELISRVAYGGERFVITRHGRPVAELVPAQAA